MPLKAGWRHTVAVAGTWLCSAVPHVHATWSDRYEWEGEGSEEAGAAGSVQMRVTATSVVNVNVTATSVDALTAATHGWSKLVQHEADARRALLQVRHACGWSFTSSSSSGSRRGRRGKEGGEEGGVAMDREDALRVLVDNRLGAPLYARSAKDAFAHLYTLPPAHTSSVPLPPFQFPDMLRPSATAGVGGKRRRSTRRFMALRLIEGLDLPGSELNGEDFICKLRVAEAGAQPLAKGQQLLQTARSRAIRPAGGLACPHAREGMGCAMPRGGAQGGLGEGGEGGRAKVWRVQWNEVFVFEVPAQKESRLEVVVSNQAANAGRGATVGTAAVPMTAAAAPTLSERFDTIPATVHDATQPHGSVAVSSTFKAAAAGIAAETRLAAPVASSARTVGLPKSSFSGNSLKATRSSPQHAARSSRRSRATPRAQGNIEGKPTVLVAEKLGSAGIDLLKKIANVDCSYNLTPEELCAKISLCDALIVRSGTKVTREVFEASNGRLKVVGRAGVGIDNVDLHAATEAGCLVVNAPTANTVAAAEHGIALLTAMSRNISQADASMKRGEWKRSKYIGTSLVDKTLAVLGFGKVGSEVARRAKGLGMHVIAHDPYAPADRALAMGVDLVSLDDALQRADFISLHMPLTPATDKLLNDDAFAKAKRGVRIVNVARGGVIDEDALVRALDNGQVAQAALDVFTEEPPAADSALVLHPNVIVTPHLGASTTEAQEGVAVEIAEAVVGALMGELASTAVNAPMVPAELVQYHHALQQLAQLPSQPTPPLRHSSPTSWLPCLPGEQVLVELAPYVELAEKLGRLAVQLVSGGAGVKDVKVTYRTGRSSEDLDTRLLRAMIAKGLIEPISNAFINLVNADYVAKQRGIRIREERQPVDVDESVPLDTIVLEITHVQSKLASAVSEEGTITLGGKVKDGVPHLIQVGRFSTDIELEGSLLLCRQVDQPGMIGTVGMLLGSHDVNISFMSVGRTGPRKQALMAIGVDEEPSREVLRDINSIPALEEMVFLKL
ncbi:unnamed protein product [Closterium sp. Naga37s-1]|nr:unnamed protein product [Closterium sp. Naga37s-1]